MDVLGEMTLREQQSLFVKLMATFELWCFDQGYELTLGEGWRSPEEAQIQAAKGAGVAHSLHTLRLAQDLNLFEEGNIITTVNGYRPLGEYWKSLHPLARWGGDFTTRPDADHFSLTRGGIE